ncbi:MAG: hypothetical protein U9N11_00945 [Campylobacterota bacterium]|nr:hypothetical protein [Campylobacterota bacterium]
MYENLKKNALPYYNIEGKLLFYRFKKKEALELLEAFNKNNEYIISVSIFDYPSEKDYGDFVGHFECNQILEQYNEFKKYIAKIKDSEYRYFEFILKKWEYKSYSLRTGDKRYYQYKSCIY